MFYLRVRRCRKLIVVDAAETEVFQDLAVVLVVQGVVG